MHLCFLSDVEKMWNKNFNLLLIANFFLYTAVYMLFPALHHWMVSEGGYTGFQAGGAIAIFGASLFLLGAFNNYLVDTFKRKNVCTRSLLLLALLGLLYPYAGEWGMIFLLRVLQGALFGVVLMAMGSTLVIDVTPSQYRNKASVVFTWSGVLTLCPSSRTGFHGGSLFPCSVGPSVAVVRPFSAFSYLDSGFEHDGGSLHFRGAVQLDFRYFFLHLYHSRIYRLPVAGPRGS